MDIHNRKLEILDRIIIALRVNGAIVERKTIAPRVLKIDDETSANLDEQHYLEVNGVSTQSLINFSEDQERVSRVRSVGNGKVRVKLGLYGAYSIETKQYPERKNGTHDYEAIAKYIIDYVNTVHDRVRRNNIKTENETNLAILLEEIGFFPDGALIVQGSDKEDMVTVTMKPQNMSLSDFKKFHTYWMSFLWN